MISLRRTVPLILISAWTMPTSALVVHLPATAVNPSTRSTLVLRASALEELAISTSVTTGDFLVDTTGSALEKLTPIGDAIDVLDVANEAADALSAQGVRDENIIVGFAGLALAGAVGFSFFSQMKSQQQSSGGSSSKARQQAEEISQREVQIMEEIKVLKENLLTEQTMRLETQAQFISVFKANRRLFDKYRLLQEKEEELSKELAQLAEENRRLEDEYELEQNARTAQTKQTTEMLESLKEKERQLEKESKSVRKLTSKLWQVTKSRAGNQFQRLKGRFRRKKEEE